MAIKSDAPHRKDDSRDDEGTTVGRDGVTAPTAGPATNSHSRANKLGTPLVVIVGLFVLVPVGFLVFGAVWSQPPGVPGGELSFHNIARVITTAEFLVPLGNSLRIGLTVGVCSIVVGGVLAWLLTKTGLSRPALWENVLLLPVYLSPLMLALAFIAIAAPRVGFVNQLLPGEGFLNVNSFSGIVWVLTVNYSGYVLLYMLGPMRALNVELEEAALVLGSNRWQILRRIIVPLLAPALFATFVIVFTLAAENFAVPSLIGRPIGIRTIPSEIYYNLAYEPTDANLAAALGLVLLVITFSGIAIYRRMVRLAGKYVTVGGKPRSTTVFRNRKYRRLPQIALTLWVAIAIVLPVSGLVFGSFLRFIAPTVSMDMLTLGNYAQILSGEGATAVRNTLMLALLAGSLAALLGSLISYTVQRTDSAGRGFLDYASTATVAIPGMALAIGLLWTYVRMPLPIWGTIWILLIAYVTRFMAHSVRATSISLLPISPQLDESAQVLGASLSRRLRTITFPLMRRGIMSAWMLVFIFVTNEISATILLFTSRSQTISVRVWNSMQMYGAMQAFAYAVVQTVIVAAVLIAIYLVFGRLGEVSGQTEVSAAKGGRK